MTVRILVVDDEPPIRKFLRIGLESQGFDVVEAETGRSALEAVVTKRPQLVILDLGLPDEDGQEVIGKLREVSDVPILILSVRAGENDKVRALDAGANDYVTKPFGIGELLARVRVLVRAREGAVAARAGFEGGGLKIDFADRTASLDGVPVGLTRREFDLLRCLAENAGKLVTQTHLLREVWGPAHTSDTQYLRVYIGQLRAKLGDDASNPRFIATEPGIGYRFADGH